jgi:hypothetical protein
MVGLLLISRKGRKVAQGSQKKPLMQPHAEPRSAQRRTRAISRKDAKPAKKTQSLTQRNTNLLKRKCKNIKNAKHPSPAVNVFSSKESGASRRGAGGEVKTSWFISDNLLY